MNTPQELYRAFRDHPSANVGVVCGRVSGLVAIDVDDGKDGGGGLGLLRRKAGLKDEPRTLSFYTARGVRYLYKVSKDPQSHVPPSRILKEGGCSVEVLGEGRLTVMPPSVHASGFVYSWSRKHKHIAWAPPWVKRLSSSGSGPAPQTVGPVTDAERIGEGSRNEWLFHMALLWAYKGVPPDLLCETLLLLNGRMLEPPLGQREVRMVARNAALYAARRKKNKG